MEPQVISDASIPLLNGGTINSTGSNSNPVTSNADAEVPTVHTDQEIPQAFIAQETIAQSLNTETKRILAEYEFESLGAFTVQSKTHPLAHISYSGDGIVAVNSAGDTTIAVDGETGDVTIIGTLQAGSIISGSVIVGDGSIVIDGGTTQINLFDSGDHNTVRLDTSGLTIFDTSAVIKAIGDSNGFTVYDLSSFRFWDTSLPGLVATLGADGVYGIALTPTQAAFGLNIAAHFYVKGKELTLVGNLNIQNGATTIGNDGANAVITNDGKTKTAIVPVENGYRALYAMESPEVWFMDFCKNKYELDPLFLEVTEGEMHWIALDGEFGYQVWRRRKGHAQTRFEKKSKEEFEQNEKFLGMSRLDN